MATPRDPGTSHLPFEIDLIEVVYGDGEIGWSVLAAMMARRGETAGWHIVGKLVATGVAELWVND